MANQGTISTATNTEQRGGEPLTPPKPAEVLKAEVDAEAAGLTPEEDLPSQPELDLGESGPSRVVWAYSPSESITITKVGGEEPYLEVTQAGKAVAILELTDGKVTKARNPDAG